MKLLLLLLALFVLIAPLRAQTDEFEFRTSKAPNGLTIPFRLLLPLNYDRTQRYPLVLFLHGAGERGTDNKAQLKHGAPTFLPGDVRQRFPCFVMAPQCPPDQKWTDIEWRAGGPMPPEPSVPMQLTLDAIDALMKDYNIDRERLYVTGLSMGGYGAWDLACRQPERWAAAVPICGGGDRRSAARAKGVAIWAFHGDSDQAVPVERSREMIEGLRAAGATPLYSEYPTVSHDSWTSAYGEPELLSWMFAQRRGLIVPFERTAHAFSQPPSSLFPGSGPVQPGIWFRTLWKERRTNWEQAKIADQGAVVFLGDSITQGWSGLAKDFPTSKVANRGLSGDTTRGLRQRVKGDVLDLKPRAVVLLIGTNDLGLGATPEQVSENVKALLGELRASSPRLPVIVCKVMPSDASKQRPAEKITQLNALVDKLVTTDPLFVRCDTHAIFADADGNAKKEEFPDLLHPNAAGYAKWKAALEPIFNQLGL